MQKIIIVTILCVFIGCRTDWKVGETITVQGIAQKAKIGSLVVLDNDEVVWVKDVLWTRDQHNKPVKVTGILTEAYDLPVFILDPESNEHVRPGIPCPPGTNLKKASHRYLIEKPVVKFLD